MSPHVRTASPNVGLDPTALGVRTDATGSPWPAPDPATRVSWMRSPVGTSPAATFTIVDDAVWGPPVAGTAVAGLTAPTSPTPEATAVAPSAPSAPTGRAGRWTREHRRRVLAAFGAGIVAAVGGLALTLSLI